MTHARTAHTFRFTSNNNCVYTVYTSIAWVPIACRVILVVGVITDLRFVQFTLTFVCANTFLFDGRVQFLVDLHILAVAVLSEKSIFKIKLTSLVATNCEIRKIP